MAAGAAGGWGGGLLSRGATSPTTTVPFQVVLRPAATGATAAKAGAISGDMPATADWGPRRQWKNAECWLRGAASAVTAAMVTAVALPRTVIGPSVGPLAL